MLLRLKMVPLVTILMFFQMIIIQEPLMSVSLLVLLKVIAVLLIVQKLIKL